MCPEIAEEQPRSSKYVYFIAVVLNLLALSRGINLGWSSPILPKLTNPNRTDENPIGHVITESEQSWIASITTLGPLIASYPWGILADRLGRKWTLVLISIPVIISPIVLAVAETVALYIFARLFVGLAFGGTTAVIFIYIGEISDVINRGKLLSLYNNFLTFGLLFSYIFGAYLSIMVFNLVIAVFPAILLCLVVAFGVESPLYLLKTGKQPEAYATFKKLRVGEEKHIENEFKAYEKAVKQSEDGTIKDLISDRVLIKALTITVALVVFQQLSGIGVVLLYAESIFEDAGSINLPPEVSAIVIGAMQFLASFSTPLFVDRAGRKFLFLFSASGMIITHTILGVYFYIKDNTDINVDNIPWLPIVTLVIFIMVYNSAFGVLPYTVMGEIFPSKVKTIAVATTGVMNSLSGFTISLLFKKMQSSLGNAGSFWLFGGFCVLALLFIILFVPETKGKSLEQIHNDLRK